MRALSRPVHSPQTGPHQRLEEIVARHRAHPFRKPAAEHSRAAYSELMAIWDGRAPLVLDTGCGVGLSTLRLARAKPDCLVVGIDQSLDRLQRRKAESRPDNALLLRADMVDIWMLLAADGARPAEQWMLYPNPWPKPQHLQRRWHGHAVFPVALSLGGRLELRSNWRIYAEEHALALGLLAGRRAAVEAWQPEAALTPFEAKYRDSGHALWRVAVELD
ncbi:SAM-dependent methyltransferase [Xenophilus sp. AP218F]|nr:SAM-dependent methyltransferase [Xenophilus sp. AP218F]